MAEPKCPSCIVEGLKYIISADSDEESKNGDPWFNVVYCSECGHVYGVFAKVVHTPTFRYPVTP
jgi:uncharacterized Zn finger protein